MTPEISFEFFPARTPALSERLRSAARDLGALRPSFCSVTHGAGGSSRELTFNAVQDVQRESGTDVAPHLAALGSRREEVEGLLARYKTLGVGRLVALRGDLPADGTVLGERVADGPQYGADLVRMIREVETQHYRLYVAAYPERHPEAPDLQTDVDRFKEKVAAGADAAITQYFYNPDAYENFLELTSAQAIKVPIIAGIMPIYDFSQISNFSARCGAEIPRWFRSRIEGIGDPSGQRDYAADVVARLCQRLISLGAPGFHFYTLNRSEPTAMVLERMGLSS